ncbi:GNAT family N-acetyltransferase [Acidisphaera sp. L21]|uniref:GNAT family N-acetyltransferase n=1 Tax=Acidisphaera sp. L21 TaxID=1641851 RepID=UPI00131B5315|nr:GNAT family N-acyltransferase [Acidisphaera sp. L21]
MPGDRTSNRSSFGELRAGHLGLRIATTPDEIDAVQALRYRVFYDEMGAEPDAAAVLSRRDCDAYDAVADHLIVVDHDVSDGPDGVVGTYRMVQREGAAIVGRFYSAAEYDIAPLLSFPGRILELGRSCVDVRYRGRAVMQLLWRGIAAYIFANEVDLMFGCASLNGTDPDAIAAELTFLQHNHLAPPALRPRAVPSRYVDMRRLPPEQIDARRVLTTLPPLVKGYLRLGGMVGDGAVIDDQFNTIDVAIVVKTDLVTGKYIDHYKRTT